MFDIMQPITRNILLCTVKVWKRKGKALCRETFICAEKLTLKLSFPMNNDGNAIEIC
jgi:hypothetical protein